MSNKAIATKDNAQAQLNAGISAVTLTIPLKSGQGALFPTTIGGSATSGGTAVALNSTGIQALGVTAGMIIENVTDGSWAVVRSVSTNAVVTTALKGGVSNTWTNGNVWRIGRFVLTLIHYAADGATITKREKILIDSRSGDTLTADAAGRGYDGSTAQSFAADDYGYIFSTTPLLDGMKDIMIDLAKWLDDVQTYKLDQGFGQIYGADAVGTDAYAINPTPALTAYADGQVFYFKAQVANTGPASLNVNGLGAKTIKKQKTVDLSDNDIVAGEIVSVAYNVTTGFFELQTPVPVGTIAVPPVTVTPETDVAAGDAGAVSTNGKVRRTQWQGLGTLGTPVTNGTVSTSGFTLGYRDLDSTHKLFFGKDNAGTPNLWWQLVTLNRTTGVPTVAAVANLTKTIANDAFDCDVAVMAADKACFVYASSGNVVKARIVSSITGSPSEGTEFTVAASNGNGCSVVYIDDSNLIFFWHDNSTQNLKYYQCTVSGGTITGGTSGNLWVDATAKIALKVRRYGTTLYMLVPYANTGDRIVRGMIATYDSGAKTFSLGSSVSSAEAMTGASVYEFNIETISDTTIAVGYNTSATVTKLRTANRNGTTLTFGTAVSATFDSHTIQCFLTKLNSRTFALAGNTTNQLNIATFELKKDETGFLAAIAVTSTAAGNFQGNLTYISPGYALVHYCNSTTPTYVPLPMTGNFGKYAGIFTADAVADGTASLQACGSTTAKTGLTAGSRYVVDIGGLIAVSDTDDPTKQYRAGQALGAATFLVQP